METTSTSAPCRGQFAVDLGLAMHTEQQFSRIIPQVMLTVSSTELFRILRSALTMSGHHQQRLIQSYGAAALKTDKPGTADDLETHISAIAAADQSGRADDLTYTFLITKIIQCKISYYEHALNLSEAENLQASQSLLRAALADEAAVALFLQELGERLFLRQFPEHVFLT